MQGLTQWVYGLFLDIMAYCANALLGVVNTDMEFFEINVPIVSTMYEIFIAIGWGLLIGNCAFQCVKAMFAGLGFETEAPVILLMRTFLFGFLLIFSREICEIGLSIGKRVIDLLGIPTSVDLVMPDATLFGTLSGSWLIVIIIGSTLSIQLLKLFLDIAERYAIVAILTLFSPVALALGGSKSTKDICSGFMRTYASMIVMMVMNVVFLKLFLSVLATMPTDLMIFPWCFLAVGIAKTGRKLDQLVSRIGLSPAMSGDPLGTGRGTMLVTMAARTIVSAAGKSGSGRFGGKSGGNTSGQTTASANHSSRNYGGNSASNVRNSTGGTNVGGNTMPAGTTQIAANDSSSSTHRNSYNSNMGGSRNATNNRSASTVRFGANTYGGTQSASNSSGRNQFTSSGNTQVNTNRFGNQPGVTSSGNNNSAADKSKSTVSTPAKVQTSQSGKKAPEVAKTGKTIRGGTASQKGAKGTAQNLAQSKSAQTAAEKTKKNRFGTGQGLGSVRHNANPVSPGRTAMPKTGIARTNPETTKTSAKPDVVEKTDTLQEVAQDIKQPVLTEDGEDNG